MRRFKSNAWYVVVALMRVCSAGEQVAKSSTAVGMAQKKISSPPFGVNHDLDTLERHTKELTGKIPRWEGTREGT